MLSTIIYAIMVICTIIFNTWFGAFLGTWIKNNGWDNDYPENKPNLKLKGYEDIVYDYLDNNCSTGGQIVLDFVLGTHAHSDHIGGFDTVILKDNVTVKRAFLKPYHAEGINTYERTRWDNQEVYDQMKGALDSKSIPITESFDFNIM